MKPTRLTLLTFALTFPAVLCAQEVRYIDLTAIEQHTELRYPPAPPSEDRRGFKSGDTIAGPVEDPAPDIHDPHSLRATLLQVIPSEINLADQFETEFKIRNTGGTPVEIPVSPQLSDLQPTDESVDFTYLTLSLVVIVELDRGASVSGSGFGQLYGAADKPGSIVQLKPGEWIRVKAKVGPFMQSSKSGPAQVRGDFQLRSDTFRPHPGGYSTETHILYPQNSTPTPPIEVQLLAPTQSDQPKQSTNAPTK
jgi:hypothetical protein